jgi:SAM-dependent methyltransferase
MMPMAFTASAEVYDRFIGRYVRPLAPRFADFAGITTGPVLDVGCGPGVLCAVLAERVGATNVAAVETWEPHVVACRARVPGADVRLGRFDRLPFADGAFAAALSQLMLPFVNDPTRVAAEMRRVVRPGGVVAASTFAAEGFAPTHAFWEAARQIDPETPDQEHPPFSHQGEIVELWEGAGVVEIEGETIEIEARYANFDDYWAPFVAGIGPAAEYLRAQPVPRRETIREACFEMLGNRNVGFTLRAQVLAVKGRVK